MLTKKVLGAASAALVALGVAAGPASADTIEAGGTPLSAGDLIQGTLVSSSAHFATALGDVDCSQSDFLAEITTNPNYKVSAGDLTFNNCTDTIPLITVQSATSVADFGGAAAYVAPGEGTLTLDGVEVTIDAGAVECTYSDVSNDIVGDADEATQTVTFTNQPVQRIAGNILLCPSSGTFSATYELTSLSVPGSLTITP